MESRRNHDWSTFPQELGGSRRQSRLAKYRES
jgi:hypothetical protein